MYTNVLYQMINFSFSWTFHSDHSIRLCGLNCWHKMHSMMASFNLHGFFSHLYTNIAKTLCTTQAKLHLFRYSFQNLAQHKNEQDSNMILKYSIYSKYLKRKIK